MKKISLSFAAVVCALTLALGAVSPAEAKASNKKVSIGSGVKCYTYAFAGYTSIVNGRYCANLG
jgi:ABC-type sugar transport system substrate-binding protein